MSLPARGAVQCIRIYQRWISPLKPPVCRFEPTCSSYAIQAFQQRGFLVAVALTVWRLLRCQPLCRGGYDPVPERRSAQDQGR